MFRTEALRQRIELINHLIEFGRQLILIQGGPGLGKTTLLNALVEAADPNWIFVSVIAGPTLKRASLIEKIADSLDFEPTERFEEHEVLDEIQRRLQILTKSNQIVVLTIDDAEQLPVESYGLLFELAHRDDDAIEMRVVLSANNADATMLDQLHANNDQQAVIHTVDMPHMDHEQTASLLSWWQEQEFRGDDAGRKTIFSASTVDEIHAQSKGVPGDILILARQFWLTGQNSTLRPDPVKKYIALGIVAIIAIGLFSFFGKDFGEPEVEEQLIELPTEEQVPAPKTIPDASVMETAPEPSEQVTDKAIESGNNTSPQNHEPTPDNNLGATISSNENVEHLPLVVGDNLDAMLAATLAEEITTNATTVESHSEALSSPQDEPKDQEPEKIESETPATMVKQAQMESKPETAKVQPKVVVKIRSQPEAPEPSPTLEPPVAESPPRPSSPAPAATLPKPSSPAKSSGEYSLARLLRESPNGYVLQLFGVRNHDAASKYVAKHKLDGSSTIVASMHNGEPWYVLIYGQFETREAATDVAKTLTNKLTNIKPWPRPVSSLK
ncbi:MAG: AAA family ATPase [Pseudomonadota bacterium]